MLLRTLPITGVCTYKLNRPSCYRLPRPCSDDQNCHRWAALGVFLLKTARHRYEKSLISTSQSEILLVPRVHPHHQHPPVLLYLLQDLNPDFQLIPLLERVDYLQFWRDIREKGGSHLLRVVTRLRSVPKNWLL